VHIVCTFENFDKTMTSILPEAETNPALIYHRNQSFHHRHQLPLKAVNGERGFDMDSTLIKK
jgi:hypothetical protein